MNILLDTHILLWTLTRDSKLPQQAIDLIADENNKIYYSIASIWEVIIRNIPVFYNVPISIPQAEDRLV